MILCTAGRGENNDWLALATKFPPKTLGKIGPMMS